MSTKLNNKKLKNNKKWLIGLIIVALMSGIFIYKDIQRSNRVKGTKENKEVRYSGQDGKNVFELLQSYHNIEFTRTELGIFIVSIDSLKSTEHEYWIYYVDGKIGNKAADKFLTNNSQVITWKFEELQ